MERWEAAECGKEANGTKNCIEEKEAYERSRSDRDYGCRKVYE